MEKTIFKIKVIFPKREGKTEHAKWAFQDLHLIEADESKRYPDEFLATFGNADIEKIAAFKQGDTVKCGISFGVRSYHSDEKNADFYKQVASGWGIELVQISAY